MDKLRDIPSFLPPKKFKAIPQSAWCTKNLHDITCSSGNKNYTELGKILNN